MGRLVAGDRDPQLFEMIEALRRTRPFAGVLNRRQKQRDQNPDDRNRHEQFEQRETPAASTRSAGWAAWRASAGK